MTTQPAEMPGYPAGRVRLAVIGGGPGGYPAAFLAADMGMHVTLIDEEPNPGGVCLYRGCIPSKALLHVAGLIEEARLAEDWGVAFGEPAIDLDRLRGFKQGVVDRLTGGLGQLSRQHDVHSVQGRATFLDAHTVSVAPADGGPPETIEFDYAIVATGSSPSRIPALDIDSPRVLDSTSALELERVPETLLVIGGGYIGLELGSVYAALGSRVTVVEMTAGLLPGVDRDLVRQLQRRLRRSFEAIRLEATVLAMEETADGIRARIAGNEGEPEEHVYDQVLVAVGRRPNSAGLGLEHTSVRIDARGFIETDGQRRTAEPNIFAVGDVAGEPMLAHKAAHEAPIAVEAIAGKPSAWGERVVPAVIYTDPEIAWAGLTETDATRPPHRGRGVDDAMGRLGPRNDDRPQRRRDEAPAGAAHAPRARRRYRGQGRGRADQRGGARHRDGRGRAGPRVDHPPPPDAVGDTDARRRCLLRPQPGLRRAAQAVG